MPLVNFDDASGWNPGHHDVVIVGAGAAGLFLAASLCRNFRVVVLESGHFEIDPANQQLNEIESTGQPMLSAVDGRKRAVGGTTTAWGGQSLPFSPIDFQCRDWVPGSGWPIDSRALWRHYQNANRAMGIDQLDYDDEAFDRLSIERLAFDPQLIRFHLSKWAPEPNFRRIFARHISNSFTVAYNCTLLDFEIEGATVRAAVCAGRAGYRQRLSCSRMIIACGGLESNRLLLWLQSRHRFLASGPANRLGQGFMEHPCINAGTIAHTNGYDFQRRFNTQIRRGRKYSLRMSAAESWQRHRKLLNISASVGMQYPGDAVDPYAEFRSFSNLRSLRGRLMSTALSFSVTALAYARHRFIYKRGAVGELYLCAEQEPTADSTLRLGDKSDRFGIPRLVVNWALTSRTWATVVEFAAVVRSEVERLGLGEVRLRDEILAGERRDDLLHDIGHHMGGTALGAVESESVVDPDLRVRGLENAWICSASVFPTGSHSNPTLTVLALADRLAEKLQRAGPAP